MVFLNKVVSESQNITASIIAEDTNKDVPNTVLLNKFSKIDDTVASRPLNSDVINLQNSSLWSLNNSFQAMRVSHDKKYDGIDEWTGQHIKSYIADPPEPDSRPIQNVRRYQTFEHVPKARGEQLAKLPLPDRTVNGRNFNKLQSNDLSTIRLSNSHPLLGNDRSQSKVLKPTTLHANDITPSMMMGEEGPHGAYGDRTHRAEYFKGGLHPSIRHKQTVNGVNNLKANAADYGHVSQSDHHARMLPDQNRTPQLKENSETIDQANNILNSTNRVTAEIPDTIKVGRVPVRFDNNPLKKEGENLQALPPHLRSQNLPYAAVPTANQSQYKAHERNNGSHFHKERNAPEVSVALLKQDYSSAQHVFKIDGALPTNKEKINYPSKLSSDKLTYNNRAFESEIQMARRQDVQVKNPELKPEQNSSNYATRTSIGNRDKTRMNERLDKAGFDVERPLPVDRKTIKNELAPPKAVSQVPVNRYHINGSESKSTDIPHVRLPSGKRSLERNVVNPERLSADFTATGWKMDSSQRLNDTVTFKTNPEVGRSTPVALNASAFSFNNNPHMRSKDADYAEARLSSSTVARVTNGVLAQTHPSSITEAMTGDDNNTKLNSFSMPISAQHSGQTWHSTYISGKY